MRFAPYTTWITTSILILTLASVALGDGSVAKYPIPVEEELIAPRKVIEELFGDQLRAAKTYDEKLEMAKELLDLAQTAGDRWERYALLKQAKDLSVEARDLTAAFSAIDVLAETFRVEKIDLRTETLDKLFGKATDEKTLRWLAESDLSLENDPKTSHLAAQAWYNLAKKTENPLAYSARERAMIHYKAALATLSGLDKLQAEKRIAECEEEIKNRTSTTGRYGRGRVLEVDCTKGLSALAAVQAQRGAARAYGVPIEFANSIGMRFRFIPAGKFLMGLPEKEPKRDESEKQQVVTIATPFYMCMTEVTQAQYWRVTGQKPSKHKDRPFQPVEQVTWHDAQAFCQGLSDLDKKRTYALPSEAQWEYACRAGTLENTYGPLAKIAWYNNNSKDGTKLVGRLAPNVWGLYDCIGNVWEFCTVKDEGGNIGIRGGSWESKIDDGWLRAGKRRGWSKDESSPALGIRVIVPL